MPMFGFNNLGNKLESFAYDEDDQHHKLGGRLSDDVEDIITRLNEDYERYYGSGTKLNLIQRIMENDEETDEIMKDKNFKRITKQEIFDIVSLYAFCYGIIYAFENLHPEVEFD